MKIENDNRKELLNALEKQVKIALEAVGYQAVSDVTKDPISVDTGLMKNSITFCLSGEAPKLGSYRADRGDGRGSYTGRAPDEHPPALYIGTNVTYAKYIELGTSKMRAKPFFLYKLKANLGNYKNILIKYLKQ